MEARYQQCGVFYQKGDFKEAKARFESFLKDFPESYLCLEVRRMAALCDERLASPWQAPEASAKPASPQKPAGKLMEDTTAKLERTLAEAEKMFKAGQYEKALKAYQDFRRAFPLSEKDESALFRIGQCHEGLGEYDKAADAWNEVIMKSRGRPESEYADDSLLALGDLYLHTRGEPEKAQPYYQALRETMPESSLIFEATHQLGLIFFYQGALNEALAIFEKERESNPQDTNAPPDSLTRLIEACKGERSYVPEFVETPQGQRALAHARRGDVFFTAKEYKKARKAYEEAERLAPGTEEGGYALMQAARCFTQLKECKKAIDCYKGFLGKYKTSPHAPDALLRMAVVYVSHIGDDPSGKKILETIAKDYPDHEKAQTALYYLATLDLWDKRWKQAKTRYLALMERYPNTKYIPYITNTILPEIEGHTKERRWDADKKE